MLIVSLLSITPLVRGQQVPEMLNFLYQRTMNDQNRTYKLEAPVQQTVGPPKI
jgi:hypothetical protein